MRHRFAGVGVQQVQFFCGAEKMADGTKMFFAGGWPETVVQPVLKFIHHERGDGIQRKSVFFFYPFKKETRCVAVVPIGGFFFCFGHEREPLFNPFPHGRKPERFIAQVSEYAPDMGSLEFLVSGTFVGVGDFLSSFPEFFGRLFRSGRRFNGNLCGAGNSFPRSGREFAGKLSNPEPGCWKMSDDGHGLLTQFFTQNVNAF